MSETELILKNIWSNIYGNNGKDSIEIIQNNIPLLKNCEDNILQHPFCHETAHQCLTRITDKNEKYLEQHKFRIEIFKIIWENAIQKNILNDLNYKDKYGYTAIQRLLVDFPRKLHDESCEFKSYHIDYDNIDPDLAYWIQGNIGEKYKLHLNPIKKNRNCRYSFSDEDEVLYPMDYYGNVTNNGVNIELGKNI
tara:strand:+ start:303 stop:884 length:582 start_codon:yes stop_codon:yes gene_type:complete